MHQLGYIHRDIKPENILVNVGLGGAQLAAVKVADLGEVCRVNGENKEFTVGTVGYMAPEMI